MAESKKSFVLRLILQVNAMDIFESFLSKEEKGSME